MTLRRALRALLRLRPDAQVWRARGRWRVQYGGPHVVYCYQERRLRDVLRYALAGARAREGR